MAENAEFPPLAERVTPMFGRPDEELLASLHDLRMRLCGYGAAWDERCDCKFGASGRGEQTGCPEIRQAIAIISGQREQVGITRQMFEESAANTLREVGRLVDKFRAQDSGRTE